MMSHSEKTVSIYEIAGFVGIALPSAMTPNNIINTLKKTGIFPYNSHAFRDDDFLEFSFRTAPCNRCVRGNGQCNRFIIFSM